MSGHPDPPADPITLPLLPLRDVVVFPHMVIPLFVGRPKSIKALEAAMEAGQEHHAGGAEVRRQGRARRRRHVRDRLRLQHPADAEAARRHGEGAGRRHAARAHRTRSSTTATHFVADVDADRRPTPTRTPEVEALRRAVIAAVRPVRQAEQEDPAGDPDLDRRHRRRRPPGRHHRRAPAAQARAEAGSARDVRRRQAPRAPARRSSKHEVDILQVEKRIRGRVKRQMEKSQREYYLNEQVKAIQKELGEGEEGADLEELEKKIKAATHAEGSAQEGRGRAQEAAS